MIDFKNINNKYVELFLFLTLFFFLEYEYYYFVVPLFKENMGFDFAFSLWKYGLVKLFLTGLLFINYKLKEFNYFVNSLFLIFLSFPSIILFEFMPGTPISISLFIILFHVLFYLSSLIKFDIKTDKYIINKKYSLYIILGITILMLIPFFIIYGFKINTDALLFKDVYKIRAEAAIKATVLTSYFLPWLIKIIIPIGIIISLHKKKCLLVVIFILAQLYIFSTGAHKSAFFSIFVVFIMYIKTYRKQVAFILFSFIVLIIASKLISIFGENIYPESYSVRRTFFIPAIIISDYFDFFKSQPIHLSHSILHKFIEYPYELQPTHLIGKEYFSNPASNVNTGFIGDGFMNFGYIGVLINIIGVILIFKIIELFKISYIYSGILLIIIYTLISSYFLTSLLTHGIILFIIFCLLFLQNTELENR